MFYLTLHAFFYNSKYHEKRLISNVFREWNKESRFTRNEWRLTVKAQCHHK